MLCPEFRPTLIGSPLFEYSRRVECRILHRAGSHREVMSDGTGFHPAEGQVSRSVGGHSQQTSSGTQLEAVQWPSCRTADSDGSATQRGVRYTLDA